MKATTFGWILCTFGIGAGLAGSSARGADFFPSFAPPGRHVGTVRGSTSYIHRAGDPADPKVAEVAQGNFSIGAPIYQSKETVWSLNGRLGVLDVHTAGFIPEPTQRVQVPGHLWTVGAGASVLHMDSEQKAWIGSFTLMSPSDKPFDAWNTISIVANAGYSWPSSEASRWLLLVNYSNIRAFLPNIPLPGLAYFYRPSERLMLTLGLPFFGGKWNFADRWTLSGGGVVPFNFNARLGYRLNKTAELFSRFEYDQQIFLRRSRGDSRDRLFYDQKRGGLGCTFSLAKLASLDVFGGYVFHQAVFEGRRYQEVRGGKLRFNASWFAEAQLEARLW